MWIETLLILHHGDISLHLVQPINEALVQTVKSLQS